MRMNDSLTPPLSSAWVNVENWSAQHKTMCIYYWKILARYQFAVYIKTSGKCCYLPVTIIWFRTETWQRYCSPRSLWKLNQFSHDEELGLRSCHYFPHSVLLQQTITNFSLVKTNHFCTTNHLRFCLSDTFLCSPQNTSQSRKETYNTRNLWRTTSSSQ